MHKTFLMSFSDKRDDRRTAVRRYIGTAVQIDIHLPPLDKRYSPIISSICGPNNKQPWLPIIQAPNHSRLNFIISDKCFTKKILGIKPTCPLATSCIH